MKKSIAFVYGIIAYVIFLAAFLYAIPFIGGFWVPKTLDTGSQSSIIYAVIIDLILLSIFAVQHSVMARPQFKKWWTKIIPRSIERSTYVLLASVILLLIYWLWQPLPTVVWDVQSQPFVILLYALFTVGWLIVFLATFMINHFHLFGLKQVYEYMNNMEIKQPEFRIKYFYRFVRHPIMLGFIIAFWAVPFMTFGHLLFSAVSTLYILIAVKFLEERDLVKFHGEKYEQYQKNVPMLIPH